MLPQNSPTSRCTRKASCSATATSSTNTSTPTWSCSSRKEWTLRQRVSLRSKISANRYPLFYDSISSSQLRFPQRVLGGHRHWTHTVQLAAPPSQRSCFGGELREFCCGELLSHSIHFHVVRLHCVCIHFGCSTRTGASASVALR